MTATATAHNRWLAERKSMIGGSDSYGAAGVVDELGRPYFGKTPLSVYLDKTTDVEEAADEDLEWGHRHEATIAQAYTDRTGRPTQVARVIRRDREHPFLGASLDRVVRTGKQSYRRILEIKTSRDARAWGPEHDGPAAVPPHYYCQVQHYLMVTRAQVADLAVLVNGSDFRIYEIEPDRDYIGELREREVKLWKEHVEPRVPPEPQIHEIAMRYPVATERAVKCQPFHEQVVRALAKLRAEIKEREELKERMERQIQSWMNDARFLVDAEGQTTLVDWMTVTPKEASLDAKKLAAQDPELYAELVRRYGKPARPYRRFTLKLKED